MSFGTENSTSSPGTCLPLGHTSCLDIDAWQGGGCGVISLDLKSSVACQPFLLGSWGQEEEECVHVCSVDRAHPVLQSSLWLPLRSVERGSHPSCWQLALQSGPSHPSGLSQRQCPGQSVPPSSCSPFVDKTPFQFDYKTLHNSLYLYSE